MDAERQQLGSQYRAVVDRATTANHADRFEEATTLLGPVIAYCDSLRTSGRHLVSVTNTSEYQSYMASQASDTPVDWVDMACPTAYKARAYLAIEAHDPNTSLKFLDQATTLAPLWADAWVERGYTLNELHRSSEALADYQHALELVERYPSNAPNKAIALRGIGYTQVELGNLDAGERAYRDSLVVEPDNALAKRELEYIRRQREMAVP